MKYFFILGNNKALAVAEMTSLFGSEGIELANQDTALAETEIEPPETIRRMGGVIKIGRIIRETKFNALAADIIDILKSEEEKITFGLSAYTDKALDLKKIGLSIKQRLKNAGQSARFVVSKEKNLSSVVVEQNKLTGKGYEFTIIQNGNKLLLGQTEAVQPFKELSFRDYGRPARDDRSGMIPPKLAQIMINLSGTETDSAVADVFCGSGTIVNEMIRMGYKKVYGSDISEGAVLDTKKNADWLQRRFGLKTNLKISHCDATALHRKYKPNSLRAIVSEPFLGPQRGKLDVNKIVNELNALYTNFLKSAYDVLKKDGRIVMVWPAFFVTPHSAKARRGKHNLKLITPQYSKYRIINPVPEKFRKFKFVTTTDRGGIIYGRPDQRVHREIVVLAKK